MLTLPLIAALLYTISLWHKDLRYIRFAELIVALLYIIYNFNVLAYTSMISAFIEFITTVYAIYKFDIRKTNK